MRNGQAMVRDRKTWPDMDEMMMQFSLKGQRLFPDANNNNNNNKGKRGDKYQLRPRGRSSSDAAPTNDGGQQQRQRQCRAAAAPLSKYRRKTANARERSRMREINQAFEALRRCVPHHPTTPEHEKLTKITTLRLAMRYIGSLSAALASSSSSSSSSSSLLDSSDSSLSPDQGLPESPTFLSESDLAVSPLDFEPFVDASSSSLAVDTFADYFLA